MIKLYYVKTFFTCLNIRNKHLVNKYDFTIQALKRLYINYWYDVL